AANERGLGQWSSWTQIISGVLEASSQDSESDGGSNIDQNGLSDGSIPWDMFGLMQQLGAIPTSK
ncbi:MAG: hypothetical protein VB860_06720, partial [Dehalococcoidia bacterium]